MLGVTECFLLAVMAYDRYVAICNPLHYPLVMNHKVCVQLVVASWISGFPFEIGQTCQIFSFPFCGSNQINLFFCDIPPLLQLACGDIFVNIICHSSFSVDSWILCQNYLYHLEVAIKNRTNQSLFHLLFPYHCRIFILWISHCHLFKT